MIEPNMATMLAFLTTDIDASKSELQTILSDAVHQSFNRITIDGDMSTNDTVLIMANGNSGIQLRKESKKFQKSFREGVKTVCAALAQKCVSDGEKVTKFVKIHIEQRLWKTQKKSPVALLTHYSLKLHGTDPTQIGEES